MKVIYTMVRYPSSLLLNLAFLTFIPYCSFAIIGLSDTKVKSLRLQVNGRGTIRAMNITISVTRRTNTCKRSKSKHVDNMTQYNTTIEV
jgi:hypothetical protein